MNNQKKCGGFEEAFYGSVTMGERGQIVIPAQARQELGYHPGDKLLIVRHPVHTGLMIFKIDAMREFLDDMAAGLQAVEAQLHEGSGED